MDDNRNILDPDEKDPSIDDFTQRIDWISPLGNYVFFTFS